MEKRTDMRAEALDTLIDIERNKKLSHIAIGETLMRASDKKAMLDELRNGTSIQ